MDRIIDISSADRLAVVQPGVNLGDLDAAAAQHGLMLGHDPWSVSIATVGGAISTDSVGYRASKYGSMGQQVRALEVVLGTGEVVRTRAIARQSSGPMLNGLFVGAEGTMGIVTEATIELFALPEAREFATVGFESFEAGYPVVVRMFDMGLAPALADLTEEEPGEDAAGFRCLLYLGFEGYREEVAAQRTRTLAEAMAAGGTDLGPAPTQHYWDTRHAVAERWRDTMRPLRPTGALERTPAALGRLSPRVAACLARAGVQAARRGHRRGPRALGPRGGRLDRPTALLGCSWQTPAIHLLIHAGGRRCGKRSTPCWRAHSPWAAALSTATVSAPSSTRGQPANGAMRSFWRGCSSAPPTLRASSTPASSGCNLPFLSERPELWLISAKKR